MSDELEKLKAESAVLHGATTALLMTLIVLLRNNDVLDDADMKAIRGLADDRSNGPQAQAAVAALIKLMDLKLQMIGKA